MTLPNYFLGDLPPEATLSGTMLAEACQTLKRNREQYLATRSIDHLVGVLSSISHRWLDEHYSFRKLALKDGAAATGFSQPTIARGLDGFFRELTRENLLAFLEQDLGHRLRLEEMTASPAEQQTDRASIATGAELLVHITGGKLPNPALSSLVLGLLTRSAQFVKCASGTSLIPRLFAHSLYDVEPKLGACLEIAEWRGGNAELEKALFAEADCVTATGSDETLAAIRQQVPSKARFVGYGHRVSFAYVSSGVLSGLNARKIIARAGEDVVAWNQLGCLSPHLIYVEEGGSVPPEQFAELLGQELARREETEPRGELPPEIAGAIATRRAMYEMRAAYSRSPEAPQDYPQTQIWTSPASTAWTVVYESDPQFQLSCLNRFIYVKAVTGLKQALNSAETVRGKVSTVGLAAPEDQAQGLATAWGRWGVTRVCPLGRMQTPRLSWHHDGRHALGDLVSFTDWEQ
jgi:hypothetical protein